MIAALQGFLSSAGGWALVPIFLVVTLESSAFLGLLFPGEMVALIAGALAATQTFSPWSAFATVASAAVLGDIAGYALGATGDRRCWPDGPSRAGSTKDI